MLPDTVQTAETWGVDELRAWIKVGSSPQSYEASYLRIFSAGRPWRALRWTYWEHPPRGVAMATGLPGLVDHGVKPPWIQTRPRVFEEDWRRLATRPVWPGFAGGAALYAVLAGLSLVIAGPIRAARRRRVGLCASCGYDVKGIDPPHRCPECGLEVSRANHRGR
jgi:hypothetical protein